MNAPLTKRTTDGVAFEDSPDHGRVVVFGHETEGRYSLMEYTVAPSATPPKGFGPHLHRELEETFLVRRGSLEFLLGDDVFTLDAGDFVRVPPGTRHGYANISGAPVELLVGFYPGGFEELFVKYRSDQAATPDEGFVAEAMRLHASEFEDG